MFRRVCGVHSPRGNPEKRLRSEPTRCAPILHPLDLYRSVSCVIPTWFSQLVLRQLYHYQFSQALSLIRLVPRTVCPKSIILECIRAPPLHLPTHPSEQAPAAEIGVPTCWNGPPDPSRTRRVNNGKMTASIYGKSDNLFCPPPSHNKGCCGECGPSHPGSGLRPIRPRPVCSTSRRRPRSCFPPTGLTRRGHSSPCPR